MRTQRAHDDEGVMLIVVMVVLLVISALALGVLSLIQNSFTATGAVMDARQRLYAADAATELAAGNLLADATGDLGTPDGPTCSSSLSGVNGYTASVTCAPFSAADGAWRSDRARNAILTLSTASDSLLLNGNNPLYVDGPVYSHGDITTAQTFNTLDSTWTVRTEGTGGQCASSKVTATRGKFCNTASTQAGTDPAWTLPSTGSLSAVDPTSSSSGITCTAYGNGNGNGKGNGNGNATGGVLSIPPGKYTSSPILALGLAANSACTKTGSTLWFKPGVFLFQGFTFTPSISGNGNPAYEVVAGTASSSWDGTSSPPTDGTACDPTAAGTQFVLGTGGKIVVDNQSQHLTLCAGPASSTQPALAISAAASITGTVLSTPNLASVFVTGAVYLPGAVADLTMHNKSQTYFKGGIVAFQLIAEVSASFAQTDAPIFLPACSSSDPCRSNRRVVFTAMIGGKTALTSVLLLDDGYGLTPGAGSTLQQWNVRR